VPILTSCVLEEVINVDASSCENTWFLLSVTSWKALKKSTLGR
jgi:hypothetical protein